jgi:hypothetical protein
MSPGIHSRVGADEGFATEGHRGCRGILFYLPASFRRVRSFDFAQDDENYATHSSRAHPLLSDRDLADLSTVVPVHAVLLGIWIRGNFPVRYHQGWLVDSAADFPLSSV